MLDLFNLQLFAELPGVENDDPSVEDEPELASDWNLLDDNEAVPEDAEDEGQETTQEAADEAVPVAVEEQPQPTAIQPERYFTQEDVNRIVQERLARDRKSKLVRELESLAGMDLEGIINYVKQNRIRQIADEKGITEEEARELVEREERLRRLEEEVQAERAYRENLAKTMAYQQAKARYIGNPLVKKYEAEIDAFSQNGLLCDFEAAMNYVIGQHVLRGDVFKDLKRGAQQQVLANVQKRSRLAPEAQGQAAPQGVSLTPEQKRIAWALGLTEKEYAEELAKLKKQQTKA